MNKIYKTHNAKETEPPYGAFLDYVHFIKQNKDTYIMHKDEFNYLCENLYVLYDKKISEYIQILKIWNEAIDFDEPNGIAILDVLKTIESLKKLKFSHTTEWGVLSKIDCDNLILFLKDTSEFLIVDI